MAFSCKIILHHHIRKDKTRRVYLQAMIDRKRVVVPVGLYLREDDFDAVRQCVRKGHANKKNFDAVLAKALARANDINAKYILEDKPITPDEFRQQFTKTSSKLDFIAFLQRELDGETGIAENTRKARQTVINDLHNFKSGKGLPFALISLDMLQQFQSYLRRQSNSEPTINKKLKIFKQYVDLAKAKGHVLKDPFVSVKIRNFKPNRRALQAQELKKFEDYYESPACPRNHKKVLRAFLFSCYTGLRISDIKEITWSNVHADLLIFQPVKSRYKNKEITVPMPAQAQRYLPDPPAAALAARKHGSMKVFNVYADQVMNRYLKRIADKVGVKKAVTYHFSRHTYGTMFAHGGNVVALKEIMGHGSITTTMGYVHADVELLKDAVRERFEKTRENSGV